MRTTVDNITAERGCWGCINRELLDVLGEIATDRTTMVIEALLAETLDAAGGSP
jgi:hypothetical protein